MPNTNGLMASTAVAITGADDSNLFVRKARNGDVVIDGSLSVAGDLAVAGESTLPTIAAVDISLNPVYIKNPYNLGASPINRSAVVIEGGNLRSDISDSAVSLALYKPLTRGTVDMGQGESVGSLSIFGKDTSGNTLRYAAVRGVCTSPLVNDAKGRLNFSVYTGPTFGDEIKLQIDASNNNIVATDDAVFTQNIGSTQYNLYPSLVKIATAGSITKQASATEITESRFTIPTGFTGYWSYTAQVSLGTVGTVVDGDIFTLYADVSGGSLTPINGTINIVDVAENSSNSIQIALSGIIMQQLTAGQIISFYHLEAGTYTFSSGSVQVAYNYIGNTAA